MMTEAYTELKVCSLVSPDEDIMGIHTTEVLFDDLTGESTEGIRPYSFVLDGVRYTLDACLETRNKVRAALEPFIAVASRQELDGSGDDPRIIREWAARHGYSVADKGRIPLKVSQAYHESVR